MTLDRSPGLHRQPRRDETSWIHFLTDLWGPSGAEVDVGDDCAVLPPGRYAISSDALAEGVDFRRGWAPPEALGHKALAANLSDLAASGASPRFLFLTLGIPRDLQDAWVEGLLRGMRALAAREGVGLSGGDLSASESGLFLSLTVVGLQESPPLLRSGGCPGDELFVGGPLGGARAGLALFQRGRTLGEFSAAPTSGACEERFLRRFYTPPPQADLGRFLSSRGLATCAVDLSDGLSSDLSKLCAASGCDAELDLAGLPLEEGLCEHAPAGESAVRCALRGGEDQVLLFAVHPGRAAELSEAPVPVHPIGHLAPRGAGSALRMPDGTVRPLGDEGYDHFA